MNLWIIALSMMLILLCGHAGYSVSLQGEYPVAIIAQIPLLCAISIQASLGTPLRARESEAARSLRPWRLMHMVVLASLAGLVCGLAATRLVLPGGAANGFGELGPIAIVRNILALNGAAYLCAALAGPMFGWVLPLAWAIIPYVALPTRHADPSGIITLLMEPDAAFLPAVVAIAIWVVGVVFAANDWSVAALRR